MQRSVLALPPFITKTHHPILLRSHLSLPFRHNMGNMYIVYTWVMLLLFDSFAGGSQLGEFLFEEVLSWKCVFTRFFEPFIRPQYENWNNLFIYCGFEKNMNAPLEIVYPIVHTLLCTALSSLTTHDPIIWIN